MHDGTVWCIDRHFFMDEFREFKAEMLEQSVYCSLVSTLRFCRGSLKMPPPADLKFGAKGIRGYRMILPNKLRGDRTQREAVRHSERITRFSGASRLVQPFFSALWLAFGLVRPDEDVEYEC
ncbi:MAG: hypothetical protein U5N86_12055 [Planctomycetota bacterium]|nr:hypothetical protein [Planctomycetota bacterium]